MGRPLERSALYGFPSAVCRPLHMLVPESVNFYVYMASGLTPIRTDCDLVLSAARLSQHIVEAKQEIMKHMNNFMQHNNLSLEDGKRCGPGHVKHLKQAMA